MKEDKKAFGRADKLLLAGILVLAAVCAVFLLLHGAYGRNGLEAVIETDGTVVVRASLYEDAEYLVVDGRASKVEIGTSLSMLGEDALPEKHDVNIILIKDGAVSCIESNCHNQVCVQFGELSDTEYDMPIVCLPHKLEVYVE